MSLDEDWGRSALVGTTVAGRYRVVAQRASGGRAELFEAAHVEHGAVVALAIVQVPREAAAAADRALADIAAAPVFRNPHVVPLADAGRVDAGSVFFASELVRGVALRTHMSGPMIEQRHALGVMRQVLLAAAAGHEHGIAHRDLKPENIVLTKGGDGGDFVKLLDFAPGAMLSAAAAQLGEATLARVWQSAFGDLRYISPECVLGKKVDGRADIYSVGAVLYELLTGHPPFVADDVAALMRLHAYAPIQPLHQRAPGRTFTPELEALAVGALHKTPEQRYRSAFEMVTAIDDALRSLGEPPPGEEERPKRDSLAALAPRPPEAPLPPPPVVPANVDRLVRPLPWWTRMWRWLGRMGKSQA
jgi:serine/threonine protein kinase